MSDARIIRLHYNKWGPKDGKPWVVHLSDGCHPASEVVINVPSWTEYKPEKKDEPRAYIACRGILTWKGTVAIISS